MYPSNKGINKIKQIKQREKYIYTVKYFFAVNVSKQRVFLSLCQMDRWMRPTSASTIDTVVRYLITGNDRMVISSLE